jgi:hypothetical protein
MQCKCGDRATEWVPDRDGVNVPKCSGCAKEIKTGFVPQLDWWRNFGGRDGLTPRQKAKLQA